ncbi:exodeoxyribonuclease VII large subunit [Zoogloeaceae bacteirum Par-f-2]|uniref:exodeoxyribonuclease VII large subunit n=1 Tax=Pseudothauera hydrothermalis TaxID=2184083 RepID=UPI000D25606A|nr:exodeoxyribonuclease VII large subunit [Pseudothauera hydrothermalis]AVZ79141.1 exodeoxyribonuclease VII large subunit [Zoogloeaceae bacteirum Par-f-2]
MSESGYPPLADLAGVVPVSALNRLVREKLERSFPLMWVSGELSNLTRAPSGHLYFTLKDEHAQVRCTMWRNRAQLLPFRPQNGMRVEVRAQVTLYEVRGDFQLSVENLRQAGIGNLFEAFTRLKERLAAEGLFDPAGRRPVPRFPRAVGVVTSPAAAALRDVLATLARRAPNLPVVIYPAPVQGVDAGAALADVLSKAGARAANDQVDLILLVRGGGSMEDLWAFNDEALARAIRACPVPVISGVGHETDFTIADFAADLRAATPTGAAELASAGYHAAAAELSALAMALQRAWQRKIDTCSQRLDRAALRLIHPRERLARASVALEALRERLTRRADALAERRVQQLSQLALRLRACRPQLSVAQGQLTQLERDLARSMTALLATRQNTLASLENQLQHLAPQAVLARGYSIVRDAHGRILRSSQALQSGQSVAVQLHRGGFDAQVLSIRR